MNCINRFWIQENTFLCAENFKDKNSYSAMFVNTTVGYLESETLNILLLMVK